MILLFKIIIFMILLSKIVIFMILLFEIVIFMIFVENLTDTVIIRLSSHENYYFKK